MTKLKILFVDDEPMVLQGLQRMLRSMREEWDMRFAEGAVAALDLLAKAPCDVVVTDMRMPGMNGAELLKVVLRLYPATVRLVLSGHADRDLVSQCVGVAHQYISKPCDPDLLKSIIRNTSLPSNAPLNDHIKRIVGSIDHLPGLPTTYLRLKKVLEEEHPQPDHIGDVIQQDLGMTAKVLKLVNSAFFGLRRTIESPHEAASFLGSETLKSLVLFSGIFDQVPPFRFPNFTLQDLYNHSLAVAAGAKAIAQAEKVSVKVRDETFVSGLLHDVGILVLAMNFPEAYGRLCGRVLAEQVSLPMAECDEFGVSHAEVGAYLLGLWGIPEPILKVVGGHHRPIGVEYTEFSSLLTVHVADVLVGHSGKQPMWEFIDLDGEVLGKSGLGARLGNWRNHLGEH